MLFFIYQEEKVARDIYITLGRIYRDENVFTSMQISVQRHIDSVRRLCQKYGVEISQVNEDTVGVFDLDVLKTLYDVSIEQGARSLHDALEISEFIETTCIDDLEQASVDMPSDVEYILQDLKKSSLKHIDVLHELLYRAA